jgi:hypothetical protein
MVLIKSGDKVLHTTVGNSDQGIKTGYIEFSHYIQLDGLSPDFVCDLEVFSLVKFCIKRHIYLILYIKRASQDAVTEKNKGKMGTLQKLLKHTPLGAGPNTTIGLFFIHTCHLTHIFRRSLFLIPIHSDDGSRLSKDWPFNTQSITLVSTEVHSV